MTQKPKVVIGMPRYGYTAHFDSVRAALCWATSGACEVIGIFSPGTSLLNHCFNKCWVQALNMRKAGATHFAMLHSDIAPDAGWLDVLVGELLRLDADVVSCVVPIKNNRGLTSTAVQVSEDLWGPPMPRRLTMREAFELPQTFGSEDVGGPILLNTGCWVCDLTKPWCENVWFESLERILKKPDGDFIEQCISEDWLFSARLHYKNAKLYATRKVQLKHIGETEFSNGHPWGAWQTDEVYQTALSELKGSSDACEVHKGCQLPAERPEAVAGV